MGTNNSWRPAGVLGDLLPGELNDACCWACSGGGDVICCDGCRAVYHLACINLGSLPNDDYYCPLCSCKQCGGPCKTLHPAVCRSTQFIPVQTKTLPARQAPTAKLPEGPGYVCPQEVRLWLQHASQPASHDSTPACKAASGAKAAAAAAAADQATLEPLPKRQRRDPVASSAASSAQQTAPAEDSISTSKDIYVRCCCCQRCCHVSCLPANEQQHLAAWSARAVNSSSGGKDTAGTSARSSRKIRSPRGRKQQATQEQDQQQQEQERKEQERKEQERQPVQPWLCSERCKQTATALAQQCTRGVVQLTQLADGTPVSWQLIQPAAVAAALAPPAAATLTDATAAATAGDVSATAEARAALAESFAGAATPVPAVPSCSLLGTGVAAGYTQGQAQVLAQVLRDAQQLLLHQLGPMWEVRTHQHALPWLLSGLRQATSGGLCDLSHFHVAVLWAGHTLAAAAVLRVFGGESGVLEVTLAATSAQLQGRRLGRALVGAVERFAFEQCGVKHAWMPALGGVVKPCVGVSVLPGWDGSNGGRQKLSLAPGCSTKLLGLTGARGSGVVAAAAAAGSSAQAAEDAAQKVPKGVAGCWALKLGYGRPADPADWLQLTSYPLLRYSYVPFVSKRLQQQTLLALPQFRRPQRAGPLPHQMPLHMQPRFPMQQLVPPPQPGMLQQQHALMAMQQQPQQQVMAPMQEGHQQQMMMLMQHPQQQMMVSLLHQQHMQLPPGFTYLDGAAAGAAHWGSVGQPHPQQALQGTVQQHAAVAEQGTGAPAVCPAAAAPPPSAAASTGVSADSAAHNNSQQQQQQQEQQSELENTMPAQQQHQLQVPERPGSQPDAAVKQPAAAAGAAAGAPSKRQQWKEQIMQQFLAQQNSFTPPTVQQQSAADHGGSAAAAAANGFADGNHAAPSTLRLPGPADVPMAESGQ